MLKKIILFLLVAAGMIALNAGFLNRKADISIVKQPQAIQIFGNQDADQLNALQAKLQKLQAKSSTSKEAQNVSSQLQALVTKDTVQTADQEFISKIMKIFKSKKAIINNGFIMQPRSGSLYSIQFGYNVQLQQDTLDEMAQNIKNGYLPDIYLYPNDLVLMPFYDEKGQSSMSTIEVRADEDTIKAITDFYHKTVDSRK